jgi:hypothetical protein
MVIGFILLFIIREVKYSIENITTEDIDKFKAELNKDIAEC